MKDNRILLDEREAADLIGLTPRFMQSRRSQGDGPPYVKISSRCIRYRPEDLRQWAAERIRQSTADPGNAA